MMEETINWSTILTPYHQAVEELKVKLRGMRKQYEIEAQYSPIESVTGRVKPISSILDKANRKKISLDEIEDKIQDIGGVRIVCQFVDDIYTIVKLLRSRNDFEIIEEKDYLKNEKKSGYRSFHVNIRYPVATIHGEKNILVEIQIRTLAMNFWAVNEHSLNYKYSGEIPDRIQKRLKRAAEAAFQLDEEMTEIREEVQEAQWIFHRQKSITRKKGGK